MASRNATTWMLQTIFLSSFFLLLLSPTNAAAASSDHLIKKACKLSFFKDFTDTECVKILASFPKIASALDFSSLEIAIIEEAINNTTDVIALIQKEVNSTGPGTYLDNCVGFYEEAIRLFKLAVAELKHPDPKHLSDLDLGVPSMYIQFCQSSFEVDGVFDSSIITTNKVLQMFIEAAANASAS